MNELKKIYRIYDEIDMTKKIVSEVMVKPVDVASSYPNLIFAPRTQQDDINKALLDDLQKAAELTGYDINVNYARTDHGKNTKSGNVSRHYTNQAVDIGKIGGKTVSPSNRDVVDKYVEALLNMGYVKNSEGGNPKAVLTFGFPDHDDHIHVSNKEDSASEVDPNYTPSSDGKTPEEKKDGKSTYGTSMGKDSDPELYKMALGIGKLIGLNEQFGKNISNRYGTISIPGSSNSVIKSPVDGVINNMKKISGCKNQVTIESSDLGYFLQYCGISKPRVKDGDTVSEGQVIGMMDGGDTAEVLMLNRSYHRENLNPKEFEKTYFEKKSNRKKKEYTPDYDGEVEKKSDTRSYVDPALAALITLPFNVFKNRYDKKTGELKQKRWAETGEKKQTDPIVINAIKAPFKKAAKFFRKEKNEESEKLKENIERIKKLLK
jgi:murein DD-endopeptidase MepM/ murein hydrolase activator NlpD